MAQKKSSPRPESIVNKIGNNDYSSGPEKQTQDWKYNYILQKSMPLWCGFV